MKKLNSCKNIYKQINGEINFSVKNSVCLLTIGLVGIFLVFNLIFTTVFERFYENTNKYYFLCNTGIYVCTFISLFIYIVISKINFRKSIVSWKQIVFGLLIGAGLIGFSHLYGLLTSGISGSNTNQEIALGIANTYKIPSIFILGIIGPIVEELTYRAGLFELLKKTIKNKVPAYIITSIFFAFIHFNFLAENIVVELISLPVYLLAGFALSFTYDKLGLVGSIAAHILNNILSILL